MPKLRRATASETIRALERLGFTQVRQRGSHIVLQRISPDRTYRVSFPCIKVR